MQETISIGAQSFEFIRREHCFFVDKSGFIKEWWENKDAVTLITRPRRFGKTLNLNMLECFFSREYAGKGELFEGLSIWEDENYRNLQGSYPVLSISFANIKGDTFEKAKKGILHTLTKLYHTHAHLRSRKYLCKEELIFFDSICPDMPEDVAALALMYLSDYMSRYYGQKVLIFLDEYDTPLQEAYIHGYWEELANFIRNLFHSTFKGNPYLERALLTGITRVGKESIFSDFNNLTVITTTSESYRTQFGFLEEEVFQALNQLGIPQEMERVKQWYDGFTFGSQKDIYNPWSITNFLKIREYRPYWANSSSNVLVSALIQQGNAQTKMNTGDLLAGKYLETEIEEEIVFHQLLRKRGALWSMLLASGYLKVADRFFSEKNGKYTYRLELTNREVHIMFQDMIRDWFADEDIPYNEFLQALLSEDVAAMNHYMNQVALSTFSFFDTGRNPIGNSAPEKFYHGFVLGLMVDLAETYRITSNRESGFGRYDIMLEPLQKDAPAFILEFKVHNPAEDTSLEDTLHKALRQIEEKQYSAELIARGIPMDHIRCYGFVFCGKKVLIG